MDRALDSHPEASVVANAAPGPYAYKVAWMALQKPQVNSLRMRNSSTRRWCCFQAYSFTAKYEVTDVTPFLYIPAFT